MTALRFPVAEDRKSTRLNSSHSQISYAVFCLNHTPTTQFYTLSLHDALPILRGVEIGPRLVDLGLDGFRVDPGDELALPDDRVEIGVELLDLTRDLATDLDRDDRVEVSRG